MRLAFAIPGDRHRRTGGFIYESTVLDRLREMGHAVEHLELPARFPDPSVDDIARTFEILGAVPAEVPILLDGFIPGTVHPDGLAALAAPVVPIIHHPLGLESGLSAERAAFLMANERAALAHMARIVVPSPFIGRVLKDAFGVASERIAVAQPGFDDAPGMRAPAEPPVILSIGLLAERKGHDVLIDALARLRDLDWRARIVGGVHDPELAEALRARAVAAGLAGRVRFDGVLDDAGIAAAYKEASIFALATRYEGYGIVFGEAMRWGLPIVTCAAGAVPDTVGDAGSVVPVDRPDAFADALRGLLTDRAAAERLASRAAARGVGLPTWRDTAGRIAEAVASVV